MSGENNEYIYQGRQYIRKYTYKVLNESSPASAMRPRSKFEFCISVIVVYPISWLHVVRIDMCKPTHTTPWNRFEVFAVIVQ